MQDSGTNRPRTSKYTPQQAPVLAIGGEKKGVSKTNPGGSNKDLSVWLSKQKHRSE